MSHILTPTAESINKVCKGICPDNSFDTTSKSVYPNEYNGEGYR